MRKRFAFIVNGLCGGGAERVLQIVLRNLDRAKYDITLINHRQEHVNELYPSDIKYLNILKSKSRAGRVWVKVYNKVNLLIYENFSPRLFRKIYLRKRFDVEIAFIEGYATRIASGGRSGKKIAWVHTDMKSNPWADIAFRSKEEQAECYLRFDCVVCVSSSSKGSFDGVYRSKRSVVIYNPIDGGEVRDMASRFLVKRDGGSPLFATVGRLVPQKGYDRPVWVGGR